MNRTGRTPLDEYKELEFQWHADIQMGLRSVAELGRAISAAETVCALEWEIHRVLRRSCNGTPAINHLLALKRVLNTIRSIGGPRHG